MKIKALGASGNEHYEDRYVKIYNLAPYLNIQLECEANRGFAPFHKVDAHRIIATTDDQEDRTSVILNELTPAKSMHTKIKQ